MTISNDERAWRGWWWWCGLDGCGGVVCDSSNDICELHMGTKHAILIGGGSGRGSGDLQVLRLSL
jgi:hypothetical protein